MTTILSLFGIIALAYVWGWMDAKRHFTKKTDEEETRPTIGDLLDGLK